MGAVGVGEGVEEDITKGWEEGDIMEGWRVGEGDIMEGWRVGEGDIMKGAYPSLQGTGGESRRGWSI